MNVEKLVPVISQRVHFDLRHHNLVPNQIGCYVLTTFDGDILYIGLTDNLHRRFAQHRDNPEKCFATLLGKAIWFYFLILDKFQINKVERTWLHAYEDEHGVKPILNKINSPVS